MAPEDAVAAALRRGKLLRLGAWSLAVAILLGSVIWFIRNRRSAAAFLVLLAAASGCDADLSDSGHAAGRPRAAFPKKHVDLGEILKEDGIREARFTVSNRGDAPLRILSLTMSCSCSSAEESSPVVEPGGDEELVVSVKPDTAGDGSASLTVRTNDARRPFTVLSVAWHARAARYLDPPELDFGAVRPGSRSERTVLVSTAVESDDRAAGGRVLQPSAHAPLTAELSESVAVGEDRIVVVLDAPESPGGGSAMIEIPLDGENAYRLMLPVRWRVRSAIEAIPSRLYLGQVDPGDELEGVVRILVEPGVEILSARAPDRPDAEISVEKAATQTDRERWAVRVRTTAVTAEGPDTFNLLIKPSGEHRALEVPVAYVVADGDKQ
ncbi:MAG: DUF1573 domain-containing protein [Planctomycetota bacterium]